MARYIDADLLWKALDMAHLFDEGNPRHIAQQVVEEQPTADVVEVKHGYCIETDYRTFDGFETVRHENEGLKCSLCCHVFRKKLLWRDNYCPECGAKMDGERKCDNG